MTEAEKRLVAASADGTFAECKGLSDDQRFVSAKLIVELAIGEFRHPAWPEWALHDNGVCLSNATISAKLDLKNLDRKATARKSQRLSSSLRFIECSFDDGFNLDDVQVQGDLLIQNCTFKGECRLDSADITGQFNANQATFESPTGNALQAQGVKAKGWFMDKAEVKGRFDINGADISDQFSADGAIFDNPGGEAVCAYRAKSVGWFMDKAVVKGVFDIRNADVTGPLCLNETVFENAGGTALLAQGVLCHGWFMDEAKITGQFYAGTANIAGPFSAEATRFENPGGDAVVAQDAKAVGWFMNDAEVYGRFDIASAEIAGPFRADAALFDNPGGDAVCAQGVKSADWFINRAKVIGRFDIMSVEIAGQFNANGATFSNREGVAIDGAFGRFLGGIFLRDDAEVHGDLDLGSSTVEKMLDFSSTTLKAGRYRALRLQDAVVVGETIFHGTKIFGHVHANRARFDGRLSFHQARISAATIARTHVNLHNELGKTFNQNDSDRQDRFKHHAIVLQEARIQGRLVLPSHLPLGIVDLSRARCDTLEDFAEGWPAPLKRKMATCSQRIYLDDADIQHLVLDGFEYAHLANPSGLAGVTGDPDSIAGARIDWLAGQSAGQLKRHFNPQPWSQVAQTLRAMGHDVAAQSISIERRVRERQADEVKAFPRFVSWLLEVVAGYGFNPWKTVSWAAMIVLACAVAYWGGAAICAHPTACGGRPLFLEVLYQNLKPTVAYAEYPSFDALFYSLDTFVPVLDLGAEAYWTPNSSVWWTFDAPLLAHPDGRPIFGTGLPIGCLLSVLFVVERLAGAILIAIAVTGFTGMLTRDDR